MSAPHLLSLPTELLIPIAQLVVLLKPDASFVLRAQSKNKTDRPQRLHAGNATFNLALTCRRLYAIAIEQAYARNHFTFETLPNYRRTSTFKVFYREIGPINAGRMTSISLRGSYADKAMSLLSKLPALRELCVDIPQWDGSDEAVSVFGDRLRELQAGDAPSLRHFRIDIGREGYVEEGQPCSYTCWIEIQCRVDEAREHLSEEGARVEIELFETDMWFDDNGVIGTMRRRYVSTGVYEMMEDT